MSKALDYLPIWILVATALGLWLLHAILCRLMVPCIIRWYERRDVVPTAVLLAAAGQPGSEENDVKIVYSTNRRVGGGGGGGGGCAVCLEEYKDGERCATIVACNHKFHSLCVLPWLMWNHTCPLCRITV